MKAKVLLVDDSSTALLMGETVFKEHTAYEVVTARDGEEAVLKAKVEKPDLILMDVVMPKMDGFEACREIRKIDGLANVPIVMVTSRGEPLNVHTGYKSGCNAYLTKPINASELLEMAHMFLGGAGDARDPKAGGRRTKIERTYPFSAPRRGGHRGQLARFSSAGCGTPIRSERLDEALRCQPDDVGGSARG